MIDLVEFTAQASPRPWWQVRVGRSRVDSDTDLAPWHPGVWIVVAGRQWGVARARWWDHRATWRNRAGCALRRHHDPVATVGDPAVSEHGVIVVPERVECSRCGHVLLGARWIGVG